VFLTGLVLLALAHIFLDNFMLQIIRTKGGDSAEMGIAISVAAFTELPAMVLYARMARRSSPQRLLCLAGWVWSLKTLLVMLAPNPQTVYLAQLLQFLSYAIYVPATVDYISRKLPQADFLKGQALAGSAFTLGSLLAAFLGGRLIDLMGVASTMLVMQAFTVIGATLFTLALLRREAK